MFAVVVEFQIKPECVVDFMPLMLANAKASVAEEPGCHQFDVCTDPERPSEVFLYELYSDAAAFETHRTMPHYLSFDAAVADMVAAKQVKTYGEVAQ